VRGNLRGNATSETPHLLEGLLAEAMDAAPGAEAMAAWRRYQAERELVARELRCRGGLLGEAVAHLLERAER
jgi:hypothetical protein